MNIVTERLHRRVRRFYQDGLKPTAIAKRCRISVPYAWKIIGGLYHYAHRSWPATTRIHHTEKVGSMVITVTERGVAILHVDALRRYDQAV